MKTTCTTAFWTKFSKHSRRCAVHAENTPVISYHQPLQTPLRPDYTAALHACLMGTQDSVSPTALITATKTALYSIYDYLAGMKTNLNNESFFFFFFLLEVLMITPAGTRKQEKWELDWQREEIGTRPGNKNWKSGKIWKVEEKEVLGVLVGNSKCWRVWCPARSWYRSLA